VCVGDGVCERKLRGVERNRRRERARECDNASGREKEGERIVCVGVCMCGSVCIGVCVHICIDLCVYIHL